MPRTLGPSLHRHLGSVLWPAFLMAGVAEALIFAVVDPQALSWFGAQPIAVSPQAIYSISFFALWALMALACALTLLLSTRGED